MRSFLLVLIVLIGASCNEEKVEKVEKVAGKMIPCPVKDRKGVCGVGVGTLDADGKYNQVCEQITFPTKEIPGNGIDEDCDGADLSIDVGNLADIDNDGDKQTENQGDCNDARSDMFIGAPEVKDNSDNDCNGIIDG